MERTFGIIDYLSIFKTLPHCDAEKKVIDDWGYTPNLYHFDGEWHVDWISSQEGDSLFDFVGNTPEEAIQNAYDGIRIVNGYIEILQ